MQIGFGAAWQSLLGPPTVLDRATRENLSKFPTGLFVETGHSHYNCLNMNRHGFYGRYIGSLPRDS